jgi:nicotinamidase/pyrazinamidase
MEEQISALLLTDIQNDFCAGGTLSVPGADEIVPVLNRYVERFLLAGLPIYACRDWHPPNTTHFKEFGGAWPAHCVAETNGARFHPDLRLPDSAIVVSKGTRPDEDAYSAFQARDEAGVLLSDSLRKLGARRIFVGGLATDYCVQATVLDAVEEGYCVVLLADAVRGVEMAPGDSKRAVKKMVSRGARTITLAAIDTELSRVKQQGTTV